VVAELDAPPGNIDVSHDGRVFFTFHPAAKPSVHKVLFDYFGRAVLAVLSSRRLRPYVARRGVALGEGALLFGAGLRVGSHRQPVRAVPDR
jgi:hypothetical protein